MTQIAPNRFPEARENGVALMRAIAEAEAEDHRAVNDDSPDGYRPGRMIAATVALLAASVIGSLVLEYYLRGLS